jgi:hypothetical protein
VSTGGYDIDGKPVNETSPKENYVLPPTDPGIPFRTFLTWDAQKAMLAVFSDVTKLGFFSLVPEPGYALNNYICNNIGFVVTNATANRMIHLAGGEITLQPNFRSPPKVGFMHYPSTMPTTADSLTAWTEILKKIVVAETAQYCAACFDGRYPTELFNSKVD